MRWKAWGDAATAVGVIMAIVLLARGLRPFASVATLAAFGSEVPWPRHELLYARAAIPLGIVITGLLGWWIVAAALAWAAVVVEVWALNPGLPGPVAATVLIITVVLALLLSVRGGFRRGRDQLGRWVLAVAGGAAVVALGPAALVILGERGGPGSAFLLVVDSRLSLAVTVIEWAALVVGVVLAVVSLARAARLRAIALLLSGGVFGAGLLFAAGDRPFGFEALGGLFDRQLALVTALILAAGVAAASVYLVDRVMDRPAAS